jgi:hypothetical protein
MAAKKTAKRASEPDAVTVYRLTKDQADAMLRKMGHLEESDRKMDAALAKDLEVKGGAVGKLARHASKWLTDPGSETTIPLTDAEAAELGKSLGRGQRLDPV